MNGPSRPGRSLRVPRWLVLVHRWLGIGMCLFFAMWFASGIVMMFVPYPSVGASARYRGATPLDMRAIRLAPGDAVARMRLNGRALNRLALLARPDGVAYVAWPQGEAPRAINAMTGRMLDPLGADAAGQQAGMFAGAAVRAIRGPYQDDQWTVAQGFNAYRPLWRVDIADQAGTILYVAALSGEVVQRTTRMQRMANYVGSVVHWIYPTILRRYPATWSGTVWYLSGAGIVLALSGFGLGLWRSAHALQRKHARQISPFRRVFRLHHLLGLFAGGCLVTWIFSGWLSVDHGLIFPTGRPDMAERSAYQGRPLADVAHEMGLASLRRIIGPSALDFTVVGGELVVAGSNALAVRTTWDANGTRLDHVSDTTIMRAVAAAWPAAGRAHIEPIAADDLYAHLVYDGLTKDAVRIWLGRDRSFFGSTWVDVDPRSGALLDVVDWRRRVYRWLFNGLHTFDVPVLNHHGTLRRLLMTPFLLAGLALSVTGAILGLRRLRGRKRREKVPV